MSSTYSTNLAIELIGTGDQAGSWGNTTNTNLGTLIEQAISGYVTQAVSTGTDTTITIPNGATGVARNMYIELTGTGGTNTNLIVPANKKLYFIFNNSTGAVTVKVSGQTGVSVPTGKKVVLTSNGTDIVNGLNYIADFGSNSATITQLTATSATITNLTLTSLVISNLSIASANITTLTSSSATITNLVNTSASITTLTNNPTFSAGTANGVLYLNGSKVATSGSALVFNGSSVSVTGNFSSSNAGSENYLLSDGTTRTSLQHNGNALYYNVNDNSATSGQFIWRNTNAFSELMRLTSTSLYTASGINVGIGTSSPSTIGVSGYTRLVLGAGSSSTDGLTIVPSGTGGIQFTDAAATKKGYMQWDASTGALAFGTAGTTKATIDSSGNLGIGTSTPGSYLSGTAKLVTYANANSQSSILVRNDSSGSSASCGIALNAYGNTWGIEIGSAAKNNNALTFQLDYGGANSTKMTLDSSGNLGLGVTPSAWTLFKVLQTTGASFAGYSAAGNNQALVINNAFYDGVWKYVNTDYANYYRQYQGQHQWFTAPSGTAGNQITGANAFVQMMTLDADGDLGLGTTTPASGVRLHVDASGGGTIRVTRLASSATAYGQLENDGTDSTLTSTGALIFQTGSSPAPRARITSGGDLLVGTTANPQSAKLYVLGSSYNATAIRVASNGNVATSYLNDSGTEVGYVQANASSTAYSTSSDRRLKSNIAPADEAGSVIDAIQIVKHDWKVGGHTRYGMIAQDLHVVAPEAVSAGDDGEQIEKTWGVDYSKLVPMLVKEIQSLRARVTALESA